MYEKIRKIQDYELKGKTVVVRTNYNTLVEDDRVLEDSKVRSSIKTIEYLLAQNCKIVLISHRGNPGGETKDDLSLMPVRFELSHILNKPVKFAHLHACENSIKFMEQGEILLLENLKFSPVEEHGTLPERVSFLAPLKKLCDVYVNDAFGTNEELSSMLDLPQMMPSCAGFGLQKEIELLNKFNENDGSPFIAIIGGANLSETKAEFIKYLMNDADKVLLGGKLATIFMKAKGMKVGSVELDAKEVKLAEKVLKETKKTKCELLLPIDHLAAESLDSKTSIEIDTQEIKKSLVAMDIGPKTLAIYREIIEGAKKVLWYGVVGAFENEVFNKGTEAIGEYIALSTPKECYKVAGGENTALAMQVLKIKPKRFNHVSIGDEMMIKYVMGESFSVLNLLTD